MMRSVGSQKYSSLKCTYMSWPLPMHCCHTSEMPIHPRLCLWGWWQPKGPLPGGSWRWRPTPKGSNLYICLWAQLRHCLLRDFHTWSLVQSLATQKDTSAGIITDQQHNHVQPKFPNTIPCQPEWDFSFPSVPLRHLISLVLWSLLTSGEALGMKPWNRDSDLHSPDLPRLDAFFSKAQRTHYSSVTLGSCQRRSPDFKGKATIHPKFTKLGLL